MRYYRLLTHDHQPLPCSSHNTARRTLVNLKSIRLPVSANIKLALVAFAFLIVAGTLYYTNRLVEEMKQSERKTVRLYASLLTRAGSAPQNADRSGVNNQDDIVSDMALELGQTIDFPAIISSADKTVESKRDSVTGKVVWYGAMTKNIDIDTTKSMDEQVLELQAYIDAMAQVNPPFPIYSVIGRDSTLIGYLFYDDSRTVTQLRMLPLVEIVIIATFVIVGYLSFSYIKRNEQSNIWVGMAKETAHQLGTPLSSLLGWIELLRYTPDDTEQVLEAAGEMERDVERLNKIAQRFSKIGSAAELKPVELNAALRNVVAYFERRLPHLGKRVTLELESSPEPVYGAINVDLFEWVFENLVRNAADAIDHHDGRIVLRVRELRNTAVIDVVDNGRGIDPKISKDIFRPGFSTKQRGWGLGLSLAKRIVEEYHGGKIVLKQSSSAGTIFRIRIPAVAAPKQAADSNEAQRPELRAGHGE